MKKLVFAIILVGLLVLSGCGSDDPSSASVPEAVPTVTPTVTPAPQMAKIVEVNSVDGGLNIRAESSTDGEILGLAETGDKFLLLIEEAKNGWYQIQYEGKTAFVSADFVTVKEVTLEEAGKLQNSGGATPTATPEANEPVSTPEATQEPVSSSSSEVTRSPEDGER